MHLKALRAFNKILTKFQSVARVIYVPKTNRFENDTEHSYNLAMTAWYIADAQKLKLDKCRLLTYALVHDMVEVYAGDVFLYASDRARKAKRIREAKAARRLRSNLPDFSDLHRTIRAYEDQKDAESRFIKVLDKLIPVITILEDGGRIWHEKNITLDMLIEKKKPYIRKSPELEDVFKEIESYLARNKQLFSKQKIKNETNRR